MAKWEVDIVVRFVERVVVDADDWSGAVDAAEATNVWIENSERVSDVSPVRQVGEPWATAQWYDLHGQGDVIVAKRAFGNVFTERDIALLKTRLEEIGLSVLDHWNGAGCGTVSFRCAGRFSDGAHSEEWAAGWAAVPICQPRPPDDGDSDAEGA